MSSRCPQEKNFPVIILQNIKIPPLPVNRQITWIVMPCVGKNVTRLKPYYSLLVPSICNCVIRIWTDSKCPSMCLKPASQAMQVFV